MNQELRPANRSVFLTFKVKIYDTNGRRGHPIICVYTFWSQINNSVPVPQDPDQTTVDIVEMIDVNNGVPSMQNPFKIPIKPKKEIQNTHASYC